MNNLKALRKAKKLNQPDVAKALKISVPTYSRYETGKNEPSNDMLIQLANFFGVTTDYLLNKVPEGNKKGPRKKGVKIPILGRIPAGIPFEAITDIEGYEEIDPDKASEGQFFALHIQGKSMEPTIMDGDLIICRAQPEVPNGKIAIVRINGDDATCKRVYLQKDGITLVGDNQEVYPPHFFSAKAVVEKPVEIIAQVIQSRKGLE